MDITTEPTFTIEEFVYSWVPGVHWIPRDIETLGYTTAKLGILVAPLMAKAVWIYQWGVIPAEVVKMHGGRWIAARYLATQESWSLSRFMSKWDRRITAARNPAFLVLATSLVAQHHTLTSPAPTEALRSEPGQTSWWRSVAQSLTGTGPGIGGADVGI